MESNQPPFQKTFAVHPCMVRGASLDSDTCKNHGKLQQELVGGVPTPLKNMSQLGWIFPIYGKNVPNHQPEKTLLSKWGRSIAISVR